MLKVINDSLNKVNDSLAIDVSLPMPNNEHLAKASTVNFLLGTTAICYGLISKKKSYYFIGGLAVISAWILKEEMKQE